jgi:DNA-directed RNA polymerase specialized sigma24 family protein
VRSTDNQGARLVVDALRGGEPGAYAQLYDRFAQSLYGYCRVMVDDQAADAVGDALVTAARQSGALPDDEALAHLLFGLARAECRRRGPLRPHRDPAAGLLDRAFAGLRPDQREILRLAGPARMEPPEVARLLGVATDTAESLVLTAAKRLEQAVYPMLAAERVTWTAEYHELVTALGAGTLPRLLDKSDPRLPDDHRTRVLAALGAPPPVRAMVVAAPRHGHRGSARRHRLLEAMGVAACVTIALGAYALWPAATGGGPNRLSLLVHASQAHRHTGSGSPASASHGTVTTPDRAVRISPSPSPTTPVPAAPVITKARTPAPRPPTSGAPTAPGTPSTVPTTPSPSVSPSATPSP